MEPDAAPLRDQELQTGASTPAPIDEPHGLQIAAPVYGDEPPSARGAWPHTKKEQI